MANPSRLKTWVRHLQLFFAKAFKETIGQLESKRFATQRLQPSQSNFV
ncbi:hypothetical protein IQ235_05365 [Oscillatoriales cyanobacterium LEGE 11467]|uniref:Uncharacterized protein n=1 Tax=Zarconia navalis LEGE 11467 TaxID=1828826 RepID=A0A928VU67_9CYAN|nr:hypothetical protein [Zarconia navalis]MBE9040221.1 hypothetical protein [Zarconia navalis LEGE 11467]